jgi:hypothetical protein
MCSPSDISHLPGAPFSDKEVDEAVAAVQGAFGWHVAPEESATAVISVPAMERVLRLPTKHLVSVDEVRIDDVVVDPADYGIRLDTAEVIKRVGFWPADYSNIEVDFTHGFEETPQALLPLLAEAAAIDRRDQSVKPYRLSFDEYDSWLPRRYSINWIPGMA